MSEHTPTPWQIGITLYPPVHFYGEADAAGYCRAIGSCVTAFGKENDEANAAFICKAVNSHDALVTFAKFIRDGYDRTDINHVDFRVGAYKAALDVLASAVGSVKVRGEP
jgi:hypothetical protein